MAGVLKPYDRTFAAISNGQIRLDFSATAGNAVLSAIQVDDVPVVSSAVSFLSGLESAAPPCPAAGVTLFAATDTGHLFWCSAGGDWHPVGDVRNGAPALVALDECSGQGKDATGTVTSDCAGLLRALIRKGDGSGFSLVGVNMATVGGIWSPVK